MTPADTPQTAPTVTILGAGALGAAYASALYDMDPASVAFLARGERRERLLREGVVVNGKPYMIPVITPDDAPQGDGTPSDLVIVALKHQHLADAVGDLRCCVGEATTIISVMNGLDSEDVLADAYGWDRVLYAIAVGIDAVRTDNAVRFSKLGKIIFGEADNTTPGPRVERVQALLGRAGIPHETPDDMLRAMWWKFMVNVGINQASAVLRAPYHAFQTDEHAQAVMLASVEEVVALARAEGINLGADAVDEWLTVMHTLHPEGKTSMLQDVEAGRVTEVDIFAGKVVALGARHGVPTPVNALLLHAIKAIEAVQSAS